MNKKRYVNFIILSIIVIILSGCTNNSKEYVESKTDFLMDTVVKIDIYEKNKEKTMDKVYARLFEIENRMSKTIVDSDVSKVNKNAGKESIKINGDTYKVLEQSKEFAEKTKGAFDPTIGYLVELWNIKENDLERDWIPSEKEIEEVKSEVDYKKLELLDENKVRLKDNSISLDLGAIAKGYAADEAKDILIKDGVNSAIVDLGGNLYLIGKKYDGSPWSIGIQDPFVDTGKHMGVLSVENKSVVTSGNYERYFEIDDIRYHHIIDPKTGYPSESDLASVSIVSDESIIGDVYATAFYILGYEKSMELIDELDENIDAIFITKDKKVYLTEGIKNNFEISDKKKFKLVD